MKVEKGHVGLMTDRKVIVRIKGGLGNQLFCYAVARRLSLINNAELVIDDVSGFLRDTHCRKYSLDYFQIPIRKATPAERMEPFERYRRGIAKFIARQKQFQQREYIEQEGIDFDPRMLEIYPTGTLYLDGLWQSEGYFRDVEKIIRQDLHIVPPKDSENLKMMDKIISTNSVCVHYRWFDSPDTSASHNLNRDYYIAALDFIKERVSAPHFILFSDNPEAALEILGLPDDTTTCVRHNNDDESAYADLWLMTKCKHYIIANSTFSWWGAWLGESESTIIVAPGMSSLKSYTAWGFRGLLPDRWNLIT